MDWNRTRAPRYQARNRIGKARRDWKEGNRSRPASGRAPRRWKRRRETMRALAVFHCVQWGVVEQRIGHVGVERAFAPALFDLLVASIVGAFGIDVARERDPFPIRRPERIANSRGKYGELSGFATAGGR